MFSGFIQDRKLQKRKLVRLNFDQERLSSSPRGQVLRKTQPGV